MNKKIYIFRHGETEYNRLGMMQGRSVNIGLNEEGISQTKKFYKFYKSIPFEIVYSSDLTRSIQSISGFIGDGIKHIEDPRISEISWGINEGQKFSDVVTKRFKDMIAEWGKGNLDARIENGESGTMLRVRLNSFLTDICSREEKLILISSHGRSMKMLLALMTNTPVAEMEKFHHHNTGLYVLNCTNKICEIETENDISHLQ